MSQSVRVRRRRGFTLIEMLVVIMIIAMLMGMTSFAIWKVIQNAKVAKIAVEIDQLAQAMQGYKQTRIQYPPCMGNVTVTDRKQNLLRHISLAYTNANYGSSAADYDRLRNRIFNTNTNGGDWAYNYLNAANAVTQLDLNTLDQAEALVFWLGGFPTPVNSTKAPIAGRRTFGFHRDEDNPFKRDIAFESPTPLNYRTDPQFSFDELRLVDNDKDGWLEYAPLIQRSGESSAPYVYFDSPTYGLSTNTTTTGFMHYSYPRPDNNGTVFAAAQQLGVKFGIAAPMATYMDAAKVNPVRWANNTGFQIVCAGLDGVYSTPIASNATLANSQRAPVFPNGMVFSGTVTALTTTGFYSQFDLDNQTNLSNKTLDGARAEALK